MFINTVELAECPIFRGKIKDLAEYMAGWKETTGNYILCEMEFKRRQNKGNAVRGWLSLAISLIALGMSAVAIVTGQMP